MIARFLRLIVIFLIIASCDNTDSRSPNTDLENGQIPMQQSDATDCELIIRQDDNELLATITFSNPDSRPLYLLRSTTLQEDEMTRNAFAITSDARTIGYIGMLVKRAAPTEQDWITIESGGSVSSTVDLRSYYDFPKNKNISYSIHFNGI